MHIVIVPGFMTDSELWNDILPSLQALGSVTHADLNRAATIREMAQHVLAGAPDHFAIIGFSMGGYVAREVVRLAPERVQALVLVATSARADTPEQARRKMASVKAANPLRFRGLSRTAVLGSLHPDRAGDEALIERVRAMSERVGAEVFMRHAAQVRESDLDHLAAIHCPTLIVAADGDGLRSLDEARELRDGIEGATLTMVEKSGHMIPIEQPEKLAAAVASWLRRQEPR